MDNDIRSDNYSLINEADISINCDVEKGPKMDFQSGSLGYFPTCINLSKSILGTGLLALPYAFKALGPLLAIPLLCIFAYFSIVGLRIYSICGMRAGVDSIGLLCRVIDRRLQIMVDCAVVVMCVGTAISYLCLIGDLLPDLSESIRYITFSRTFAIIGSMVILLPLSFVRNPKHLRYTSLIGLFGIAFLAYLSIHRLFYIGLAPNRGPLFKFSFAGLKQLNVIVFLLYIKSDAKDKSEKFMSFVINSCVLLSTAIYITVSLASFLVFGDGIESNILNNYSSETLANISKWLYICMAIFSFPLMIAPARRALTSLLPLTRLDQNVSTILIVGTSFILSLFISDLSVISSWIGVLASVPICFLLPGYLHFRYFNQDTISDKNWRENTIVSAIMAAFGVVLIATFTFM